MLRPVVRSHCSIFFKSEVHQYAPFIRRRLSRRRFLFGEPFFRRFRHPFRAARAPGFQHLPFRLPPVRGLSRRQTHLLLFQQPHHRAGRPPKDHRPDAHGAVRLRVSGGLSGRQLPPPSKARAGGSHHPYRGQGQSPDQRGRSPDVRRLFPLPGKNRHHARLPRRIAGGMEGQIRELFHLRPRGLRPPVFRRGPLAALLFGRPLRVL